MVADEADSAVAATDRIYYSLLDHSQGELYPKTPNAILRGAVFEG